MRVALGRHRRVARRCSYPGGGTARGVCWAELDALNNCGGFKHNRTTGRARRCAATARLRGAKEKNPSIRIGREENQEASVGFLLFAFKLLWRSSPKDPMELSFSLSLISGTHRVVYGGDGDVMK